MYRCTVLQVLPVLPVQPVQGSLYMYIGTVGGLPVLPVQPTKTRGLDVGSTTPPVHTFR